MRLSNTIEKPIITEKTVAQTEQDRYTFKVNKKATKGSIAESVAKMFDVDVVDVRTMVMPGKRKRVKGTNKFMKTASFKKAVVTIKEGQRIEMFASLIGGKDNDKKA